MAALAALTALVALYRLESGRAGVEITELMLGDSPARLYQARANPDDLVVLAHGFAGSRQMMEAIALTLARAGHAVVSFDFQGHGRHRTALSPDITTLTGTTEDLVRQTLFVVDEARELTDLPLAGLVGHSMATDVVIRAGERLDQAPDIAAISMYSEAVTPDHPQRLLIISGAQETRLREVALDAVAQLGPRVEGETVRDAAAERRAVAAPLVGHAGVLWSPRTASEIAEWFGTNPSPVRSGPWISVLLGAIVALTWALSPVLPREPAPATPPPSRKRAWLASIAPAPLAFGVAFTDLALLGLTGFGALALVFAIWGALALVILRWRPHGTPGPLMATLSFVLACSLAFALALDRYGAAFLPTGPRLTLMIALLPATVLFAVADRAMVSGRALLMRLALRLPFLLTLGVAMAFNIDAIGMLFTVFPVYVLYVVVYTSIAVWGARRGSPLGAALASGVILAWAIAASTPLFATA